MSRKIFSLRALQAISTISALVAIVGGMTFVMFGAEGLALVVGTEYPSLSLLLEEAVSDIEPEIKITFDTWYRTLGWYWFLTGVMLLWIIPRIQYRSDWFRFIHVGFMAVGVASAITIMDSGTNIHNRYFALIPELGVPTLLIIWQWFVGRSFAGNGQIQ